MFTGIVAEKAKVIRAQRKGAAMELWLEHQLPQDARSVGDSISVNGVCLTVEKDDGKTSQFHLVEETLNRTQFKQVQEGDLVNLEPALKLGDRLHGHFVLGHVDATARVIAAAPNLKIEIPDELVQFCPYKGSICIHGVSLTIASQDANLIGVALIPETLQVTNLASLKVGDMVNIEIDSLARYIKQLS